MSRGGEGRLGWQGGVLAAAVFVLFVALYAATAQRGVSWQDSGIFQHRVVTGTFAHLGGGGLAVVHPWYLLCGRVFCNCFPEALRIYAVNLFSGVGAASALALLSVLVLQLTGRRVAAVAAVVTLGLAHIVWWLATIAEVYTWSLAFLFAELLCLLQVCRGGGRRWWWVLAAVNGCHASLHNVAFLNLPIYGVLWLVQAVERWRAEGRGRQVWYQLLREAIVCAVAWMVGACLLVIMVARELGETQAVVATIKSLLVGTGYGGAVMGTGGLEMKLAVANLALALVSVVNPSWVFVIFGARLSQGARGGGAAEGVAFRRALLGLTVAQALFWIRYFVPDQATFVLPTLGLGAVWLGLGAARCRTRWVVAVLALGVGCQVAMPPLLARVARPYAVRMRELPFRDEATYWLVPWKQSESSAQRFTAAVRETLRENDLLVGDLTAVNPLVADSIFKPLHFRLVSGWTGESAAETLELIEETLSSGGRVFVVSPLLRYTLGSILERYEFEREGVVWRVKKSLADERAK